MADLPNSSDPRLKKILKDQKIARDKQTAAEKEINRIEKLAPAGPKATASRKAELEAAKKNLEKYKKQVGDYETQYTKLYQDIQYKSGLFENLLTGEKRSAYLAAKTIMKSYGIESLSKKIFELAKEGSNAEEATIRLRETPEYKQRFAGNEVLKKKGRRVLEPGDYLATEARYAEIMREGGIPAGFWDKQDDFARLIGQEVGARELESRIELANQATVLANPQYRKALNAMGIKDNMMTAYFLDPDKALPMLQKQRATAQIGAEAFHQDMAFDKAYAEHLATRGIGLETVREGYKEIAATRESIQHLAAMEQDTYTQREAEEATIEGLGPAVQKKQRLLSRERGRFSGATGAARGGLSQQGGQRG